MASVTIAHLEVSFQVEGSDHEVFTQLFRRHIRAWSEAYEQQCGRRRRNAEDRGVGDREPR